MRTVVRDFGYVVVTIVALAALATGCAKQPPEEIAQANAALKNAMDSCATVYAKDELGKIEPLVDGMNDFATDKKYRKAKKEAIALMPAIENVQTVAGQRRDLAREALDADMQAANTAMKEADASRKEAEGLAAGSRQSAADLATALQEAEAARAELDAAMKDPQSASYSPAEVKRAEGGMAELMAAIAAARVAQAEVDYSAAKHDAAVAKLNEAKELAGDPCMYREAEAAAEEAAKLAEEARLAALESAALSKRQEEAVAALIAELRRETREALALAADLRSRPRNYLVEKGDYLWKISGMSQIYAAPKFWPLIFDANRGQIQDPDLIYPGQNLSIPREMGEGEMMDSLSVMWGKASRGEDL